MRGPIRKLARWLLSTAPGGTLTERSIKGGMWVGMMTVSDRLLQLVLLVVLASLLGPKAFGIMGIALLTVNAMMRLSKLGFDEALIQNKAENVDAYLDTQWTMQVLRGAALSVIAFAAAPLIAGVFNEPRAVDVVRFIAISPFLVGLRNPAIIYFRKNLEFHWQFVYTLSGSLLNFVVALGIAFFIVESVWALIIGYVVADLTRTLVSYAIDDYRPGLSLDPDIVRDLFGYGKWITGSGIVLFIINEGDDALVGILLSSTALGLYQVGYRVAKTPSRQISRIVTDVAFPAYSKLQDDIERLRDAFFKTVRVTTLMSFPVGVGIIVVAPTFVNAFLGPDWVPAIPTLQLIAAYGLCVSLTSTFGSVWKAVGRPDYITKVGVFRLVVMGVLAFPAIERYGITGMAAVVAGVYLFLVMPIDIYLVVKEVESSILDLLRLISYPTAASGLMGAVVYLVRTEVTLDPVFEFALLVTTGAVTYGLLVLVFETQLQWGLTHDVRQVVNTIR